MIIYVNGQDIARLVLGTLTDGQWAQEPVVLEIRPEAYLQGLEAFLQQNNLSRTDIRGFVLVQGPGSATALRTSHALVNALAFALGVEVVPVEKSSNEEDRNIVHRLTELESRTFVLPTYEREAQITEPNRDALKRKFV